MYLFCNFSYKMDKTRIIFIMFLFTLSSIYAIDNCKNQVFLPSVDENKVYAKNITSKDCSQIYFERNEKLNAHLGSLGVEAVIQNEKDFLINISFYDIKWSRAYIKLSEQNKPETSICKVYSTASLVKFPISEVYDRCFNVDNKNSSTVNYILEFKSELNTEVLYKQIVFNLPILDSFDNSVPLQTRSIFTSVDTSSNYEIILNIQTLPTFYNVTYYKVEVFREKDNNDVLLDVRMLKAEPNKDLVFEYITYNEEGHYFFKVSAVSNVCPEDACLKSVSSKIYIKRKYPPLVIGIVGASFLIPFVLFIFHMWTRRSNLQDKMEAQKDKVFMVYSQTPEKHYTIVKSLEKSLKQLANVQIVTKLSEATHIIYICGTHIFEPDLASHKQLVIEANKAISNIDIYVVTFPYSTKEIPPYLKKCLRFNLMEDFGKLIHFFNCDAEYEGTIQYQELTNKVKGAEAQTEPKKIILNMPIIIVTEQSDSETDPKEGDGLL